MDEKKSKMIDRIIKLLELGSEKNPNEHERNSAASMAAKLMADYAIDFIDLKTGKIKEEIFGREEISAVTGNKNSWEVLLASHISHAFDGRIIINNKWNSEWTICFLGTKTDIEIASFFFKYLRRTVGKQAEKAHKLKREREAFAHGMTATIGNRLTELYAKREEFIPSSCTSLMVVKKDGLADYVKQQFPNLRRGPSIKVGGSRDSYDSGRKAGEKVNLSRPIGNNSSTSGYIGG